MSVVWVFVPLGVALRSGGERIVGEELLAAVFTAKIESMPVPIGAQGRRFIHHHSANWVFGHSPSFPAIVRYLWSLKGIHSPGAITASPVIMPRLSGKPLDQCGHRDDVAQTKSNNATRHAVSKAEQPQV